MNESNQNQGYSVALDIGTTKVCVLIGRRNEHGKIEILGHGKVESKGVLKGVVSNIEKTVQAINEAMAKARRRANLPVNKVYVGIAGQHIKSMQHRGILTRDHSHEEINEDDIQSLIKDMYKLQLSAGERIVHIIPQEFTVDNEQGIADPRGMSGVRLEANFHILTGQVTAIQNLERCIQKANLSIAGMTFEPLAAGNAVLSEEEKEAGVVLVDIGGGTTDISIYHEGIVRYTAVLPIGGNLITKDIREGCSILPDRAEKLKTAYGSAMPEEVFQNRVISIPGLKGHEHKEISERNLARIIQARVEDILDYTMQKVREAGYDRKLTGGIVLTGGGAELNHINLFTAYATGMTTRIGQPAEQLANGYDKEIAGPAYATVLGLLIQGLEKPFFPDEESADEIYNRAKVTENEEELVPTSDVERKPWLDKLFEKAREIFKDENSPNF
jgi:cell division protein FtsA